MKNLLLAILLLSAVACSSSPDVVVECPSGSTCDTTVTPPPMSYQEIQYHAQQHDLAEDVLVALMIQDMTWRNCWTCYDSYATRYPSFYSQRTYYQSLPPAQRSTVVQKNNVTIIQKNTTVIQQKSAAAPASVKPSTSSSTIKTSSISSAPAVSKPSISTSSSTAPKPATSGTCGGCGGTGGGFRPSSSSSSFSSGKR